MILTNKQEEGLKVAIERYRSHEPYTCISGYAGSGKSTLVKFIIAALGVDPELVGYVAYTGKAANVLRQKGCENAITAHKLLYWARPTSEGKFIFSPRTTLEQAYQVLVVDEVSMLPKDMWELLLKHKVYVLALGDPGQLPPINPEDNNHILDKPHVFLDEIMRQAQDSEIIRLSMWIREGKPLKDFSCDGNQVKIFTNNQVVTGMYTWADQVICATNDKRNNINFTVRNMLGFGEEPTPKDKIISLSNHWETFSDDGNWNLTNGSIGNIEKYEIKTHRTPQYIGGGKTFQTLYTNIVTEDNCHFTNIPIDYKLLKTGEPALLPKEIFQINKNTKLLYSAPYDFAYAYAITCWKAQGSEWKKVLGFEEGHPFNKDEHRKYLYTLATRASDKLVLIRKD